MVLRFRASRGTERQQLRWVAAGAAGAVAGLPCVGRPPQRTGLTYRRPSCACRSAVAVAVLRYRLWDLDRLVSRTVTYALVTALLVLPYLLVVPAATPPGRRLRAAWPWPPPPWPLAALFQPLRRRVQELVDRRFNRRRYDAARTVERFAARLRDQVDLDALHARAAGGGRPDHATHPGLAVAAAAGGLLAALGGGGEPVFLAGAVEEGEDLGAVGVMATVCSKWAEREPSRVTHGPAVVEDPGLGSRPR